MELLSETAALGTVAPSSSARELVVSSARELVALADATSGTAVLGTLDGVPSISSTLGVASGVPSTPAPVLPY